MDLRSIFNFAIVWLCVLTMALLERLPFPAKELSWERLPEVAEATGFGFQMTVDLLTLVLGEPSADVDSW